MNRKQLPRGMCRTVRTPFKRKLKKRRRGSPTKNRPQAYSKQNGYSGNRHSHSCRGWH